MIPENQTLNLCMRCSLRLPGWFALLWHTPEQCWTTVKRCSPRCWIRLRLVSHLYTIIMSSSNTAAYRAGSAVTSQALEGLSADSSLSTKHYTTDIKENCCSNFLQSHTAPPHLSYMPKPTLTSAQ